MTCQAHNSSTKFQMDPLPIFLLCPPEVNRFKQAGAVPSCAARPPASHWFQMFWRRSESKAAVLSLMQIPIDHGD